MQNPLWASGPLLSAVSSELGFSTFLASPRDVHVLTISRFIRLFAYGSTTLILALYLSELGASDSKIGLFMTWTLLGDVVMSLILTLIADAVGRRRIMILGAALMSGSGVVFALRGEYWVLILASIIGVISPSGNEIGPFKAIEESTIAQLVQSKDRSDVLAWYMLSGTAGAALGILTFGWLLQELQQKFTWSTLASYRLVFWVYAVIGLIKLGLSLMLSSACENQQHAVTAKDDEERATSVISTEDDMQLENLLADTDSEPDDKDTDSDTPVNGPSDVHRTPHGHRSILSTLLPSFSPESIRILWRLCILFALDSLASGLVPASFMTYFFSTKFHIATGALGTLFFVTNILSSMTALASSSTARRIGLIKTMVFTHMPSSIALSLIPVPSSLGFAMTFLIIRNSMATMDQVPRQAFLAAAVLPEERTSVIGVVNVVKTLTQSAGPGLTGWLAENDKFWVSFVAAGGMKLVYDAMMLWLFVGYRTREEGQGAA